MSLVPPKEFSSEHRCWSIGLLGAMAAFVTVAVCLRLLARCRN